MNNKFDNQRNLSDNITNFNLCNNSFISNGSTSSRDSVTNVLFPNEEEDVRIKMAPQMNKTDYQDAYFEKQMEKSQKNQFQSEIRKPKMEKLIRDNTFKQFMVMNKLHKTEDYQEFKSRFDLVNKRSNIIAGLICFYSIYILNNIYESRLRVYENTADLINSNIIKNYSKINYKMHFAVIIPLIGILYYFRKKSKVIDIEFQNVIKERYYDDTDFDLSNYKITLRQ